MIRYGQFCPVAKTAEIFGDRWSPLIIRELYYGPRSFGDFLVAIPLISRTMLAQRLKELAAVGVVHADAKQKGRGHIYTLTEAGEAFRPMIEMMAEWGLRWGQGLIGPDDLDSKLLMGEYASTLIARILRRRNLFCASISGASPKAAVIRAIGGC
jgi:DNA-binding HxlR family transcriptional regulator